MTTSPGAGRGPRGRGRSPSPPGRDAEKLARLLRSGVLTAVWVPDEAHEAVRDLVRAREAAQDDLRRAQQRVGKLLLRHGVRAPTGMTAWGEKCMQSGRRAGAPPGVQAPVQYPRSYSEPAEHPVDEFRRSIPHHEPGRR